MRIFWFFVRKWSKFYAPHFVILLYSYYDEKNMKVGHLYQSKHKIPESIGLILLSHAWTRLEKLLCKSSVENLVGLVMTAEMFKECRSKK